LFRLVNKWKIKGKIAWKLAEFRRLMGIADGSYTDVVTLRKDVINKAVKDINKFSDLYIECLAEKQGRCVVGFCFSVGKKVG